jgi:hypothetical protein
MAASVTTRRGARVLRATSMRARATVSRLDLRRPVSGLPRSVLRALTAVERVAERQPVIALGYGVMRTLQSISRGLVFVAGVLLRACRTRGIDGALRLVHLLVWGFRASGRDESDDERCWQQPATQHTVSIVVPRSPFRVPRSSRVPGSLRAPRPLPVFRFRESR